MKIPIVLLFLFLSNLLATENENNNTILFQGEYNNQLALSKKGITPPKTKEYFLPVEFIDENTFCPKLIQKFSKDFLVQVSSRDIQKGKITCIVRDKKKMKIVKEKEFYNPIQHELYRDMILTPIDFTNSIVSDDAVRAIDFYAKNQAVLNLVAADEINDDSIVKLPNLISAITSLDTDIIDIHNSLQSGTLTLQTNKQTPNVTYEAEKKSMFLSELKEILNAVDRQYELGWLSSFSNNVEENIESETTVALQNLNNSLLFLFNSIISANQFSSKLLQWILMVVLPSSFAFLSFQILKDKNNNQNLSSKLGIAMIPGVIVFFLLAGRGSSLYEIEQNDKIEKINIDNRSIQKYIAMGYQEGDNLANNFASIIIDNYIKSKNLQHSFFSTSEIRNQELNLKKLRYEYEELKKYDIQCVESYDITKMANMKRRKNVDDSNPFLTKQLFEHYAERYKNTPLELIDYSSFYVNKKTTPIMNIDSCFKNRQRMFAIKDLETQIKKNIENFNNPTNLEMHIKLNTMLKKLTLELSEKYGYISVAFLPILSFIENSIIENKNTIDNARLKKLLFDDSMDLKGLANYAAQKAFLLTFFDTSSIMNIIGKMADATIGQAFFVGDSLSKLATVTATIYLVDHMVSVLAHLKLVIFFLISIVMFVMINIQKILIFLSSPFYLIYLFTTNQHQKMISGFAQIIFIIIKPLLFVFAMMISLIFIELFDSIFDLFTKIEFESIMNITNGIEAFIVKSGLSALFVTIKVALSTFIVYFILVNTANKIFDIVGVKIDDFTKSAVESIQHSVSNYMK